MNKGARRIVFAGARPASRACKKASLITLKYVLALQDERKTLSES